MHHPECHLKVPTIIIRKICLAVQILPLAMTHLFRKICTYVCVLPFAAYFTFDIRASITSAFKSKPTHGLSIGIFKFDRCEDQGQDYTHFDC